MGKTVFDLVKGKTIFFKRFFSSLAATNQGTNFVSRTTFKNVFKNVC